MPAKISRATDNKAVWTWDNVEPYGANLPDQNPDSLGTFTFNGRFPGQYYDTETGTHYNYFRDYDPSIGRYVESDPIGILGGLNTYVYVSARPLTGFDPRGLSDFRSECSGRYSSCSVSQDPGASTVGNWLRWKVCQAAMSDD